MLLRIRLNGFTSILRTFLIIETVLVIFSFVNCNKEYVVADDFKNILISILYTVTVPYFRQGQLSDFFYQIFNEQSVTC